MRFVFETKNEAVEFLDILKKDIAEYGCISIDRVYALATGIMFEKRPHTYYITGWKDLGTVKVENKREGYVVDLPKAESLQDEA